MPRNQLQTKSVPQQFNLDDTNGSLKEARIIVARLARCSHQCCGTREESSLGTLPGGDGSSDDARAHCGFAAPSSHPREAPALTSIRQVRYPERLFLHIRQVGRSPSTTTSHDTNNISVPHTKPHFSSHKTFVFYVSTPAIHERPPHV